MNEEILTPQAPEQEPMPVEETGQDPLEALPTQEAPTEPETVEVVDIQFRPGQKIYFFDPDALTFEPGEPVIIDTARGPEFGICAGGNHQIKSTQVVAPLRKVLRRATEADQRIVEENRRKEKVAFDICLQKIADHGLDMQLVSTEYVFDGSKIVFYFTADERVDFRELVKNLAATFHVRIELRQIGVRDKAKMVGGLGICGRPLCCGSFLADFQPVSIKMAKTQNLSLNPTKISGTCGRLMCCLKYEQEAYEDLLRTCPKAESFVDTPDGRGTVTEVNLLAQKVRVRMENQPENIGTYANADIAVLRNGKAKKTDPPIPDDLAPISGKQVVREKKPAPVEESPLLEPVKFRYRMDDVVDEPAAPTSKEPPRPRRPRRVRTGEQEQKPRPVRQGDQIKTLEQKPRPPRQSQPPKAGGEPAEAAQERRQRPNKGYRKPNHRRSGNNRPGGEPKQD